jgi:hypothetical protein
MATITYSNKKDISSNNLSINTYYHNFQILSGSDTSDAIKLAGHNVVGLITPAMDGTSITVEVSINGEDWFTLNGVSISNATDNAFELSTATIYGWQFIRFVSSTNETANRDLTVVIKEI